MQLENSSSVAVPSITEALTGSVAVALAVTQISWWVDQRFAQVGELITPAGALVQANG